MSFLVDPTQAILARALGGLTERQSLISSNLANIDTPGYTPQAIDFEGALRAEAESIEQPRGSMAGPAVGPTADLGMRTTDARHFSSGVGFGAVAAASPVPFEGSIRNDANAVDLESEMTALSETQIKYSATTRLLNSKFSQLLDVVGGR